MSISKNPLIEALDKARPDCIYFSNYADYKKFIKILFKDDFEKEITYQYRGINILYYNKCIKDLMRNDVVLKEIR